MIGLNSGLIGKRSSPAARLITTNEWAVYVGSLWTPASITTALWLDAADTTTVTESGGAVSEWRDKSGNARHFAQATAGNRPAYTAYALNNRPVIDFAADFLTSSSAASTWNFLHNSTGSSVFIAAKAGTASDPNALYGFIGTNANASSNIGCTLFYDDRISVPRNNATCALVSNGTAGNFVVNHVQANTWTPNAYQIIGAVTDPNNATTGQRSLFYVNGGSVLTSNTGSNSLTNSNATNTLDVGSCGGGTFTLTGGIAEIVITSGLISTPSRLLIEGYLAHKWGLSGNLPSDHPYKNTAPTI